MQEPVTFYWMLVIIGLMVVYGVFGAAFHVMAKKRGKK